MKRIFTLIAVVLLCSMLYAQDINVDLKKSASRALSSFSQMVTETNYKSIGFKNMEEIQKASLGEPIQVYMIKLDDLKEYKREADPSKLLVGGDYYIYPVLVDGMVRSAIDMEKLNKEWKATGYGGSNFINLVSKIRNRVSKKTSRAKSKFFIVRIPALNQFFIGHKEDNKLMLTPTMDNPEMKFIEGEPMPAESVLEMLVPIAQEHNGEPG